MRVMQLATLFFLDADGDGSGDLATNVHACEAPDGYVGNAADCDDTDAMIYLGAEKRFVV